MAYYFQTKGGVYHNFKTLKAARKGAYNIINKPGKDPYPPYQCIIYQNGIYVGTVKWDKWEVPIEIKGKDGNIIRHTKQYKLYSDGSIRDTRK